MITESQINAGITELKAKKRTLLMQNVGVGMVGGIIGVIYNVKSGGGFWRGVGFYFIGGIVVGILPRIFYFVPQTNKIDAQIKIAQNQPV